MTSANGVTYKIPLVTKISLQTPIDSDKIEEVVAVFRNCVEEIRQTAWYKDADKQKNRMDDVVIRTVHNLKMVAALLEKPVQQKI